LFGFWPKLLVFWAAVDAGLVAVAVAGIVGTVIGAYYYLKIVKIMYFDAPGEQFMRVSAPVERVLILLAAIVVSPLGYLLIGPLGSLADHAAGSIF
jgi:NADH-quinone oxidoreductase subunit N